MSYLVNARQATIIAQTDYSQVPQDFGKQVEAAVWPDVVNFLLVLGASAAIGFLIKGVVS